MGIASAGRPASAAEMTRAQRDALSPDDIIALMRKGNERFRLGQESPHDYLAQQKASAKGQYPAAVVLSCIDSRAPAETIMDLGIGDVFNARVAGNIADDDILGSMEFACKVAGAKVVLVMRHTACGAIKGAIDKAAVMIICTGVMGACVLAGALRHHEQSFRTEGAGPALAALVTLTTLVLVLPVFTTSAPGPGHST
jgi:carbonic anhydrase